MSSKKLTKRILLALSAGMFGLMPLASALPSQGAYDNSAAATIATAGSTMSITGRNTNNILNWLTFSVDKGETVRFTDANNYLNLVNGVDISRIYGTISGGGTVYLVNPYGILFGQGATLDNVGSFIASTRDISDINQQAFLNDPTNLTGVLYTDEEVSRNKDYHPENSPYVPVISVADINLTNVPASATQIVLDGPDGVVLKSTAVLDKVKYVSTRALGGEVGIGAENFNTPISLTDDQKKKIYLIDGTKWTNFYNYPYSSFLVPYQWIRNINELQAIDHHIKNNPGVYRNYMLANGIDATGYDFTSIGGNAITPSDDNTYRGTFEGMGYEISNLNESEGQGLFSSVSGTIRNLSLINPNINVAGGLYTSTKGGFENASIQGTSYPAGAVAGLFSGSMSNVYVEKGEIKSTGQIVGGLVGKLYTEDADKNPSSEIRNSYNNSDVTHRRTISIFTGAVYDTHVGGISGVVENASLINLYNKGSIFSNEGWVGGIAGTVINENNIYGTPKIISVKNDGSVTTQEQWWNVGVNGKNYSGLASANVGEIIGGMDENAMNRYYGETWKLDIATMPVIIPSQSSGSEAIKDNESTDAGSEGDIGDSTPNDNNISDGTTHSGGNSDASTVVTPTPEDALRKYNETVASIIAESEGYDESTYKKTWFDNVLDWFSGLVPVKHETKEDLAIELQDLAQKTKKSINDGNLIEQVDWKKDIVSDNEKVKIPDEISKDFASAIETAIKYSNAENQLETKGGKYFHVFGAVKDSTLNFYSPNANKYKGYTVNYTGSVLQPENLPVQAVVTYMSKEKGEKFATQKSVTLTWTGHGNINQFFSDLMDVAQDDVNGVIDACISDPLSLLNNLYASSLNESKKIYVKAAGKYGKYIDRDVVEQIIEKIAGKSDLLKRIAGITWDNL